MGSDHQIPVDFNGSLREELLRTIQPVCSSDLDSLPNSKERTTVPSVQSAITWLDADQYIFLERFHSALSVDLLEKFINTTSDSEARWFGSHILKKRLEDSENSAKLSHALSQARIKNRRFNYINEVLESEGYFSESSIQIREPELFSTLFSKLREPAPFGANVSLVDRMYYDIDMSEAQQRLDAYKDVEDDAFEEEEEEEVYEKDPQSSEAESGPESESETLLELIRLAKEKFMDGNDKNFDYSLVDHNEAYDDASIVDQEMEDKYFDADDSDFPDPNGTGVLDY